MSKVQTQLTTGKEISKPSDNPFKVARSMQLYTDIASNKQYNENIKDTINWLDSTDTALGQVNDSLQRVRELMISAGNAAYGSDEKKAIKDEINEKVSEISQILNTNFDGRYLFGGNKTTSKPVAVTEDPITGNNVLSFSGKDGEILPLNSGNPNINSQIEMIKGKMSTEISQGVNMEYNVSASDVLMFRSDKGKNINVMELLSDITKNLESSDATESSKITGENLADLTATMGNLTKIMAEVGAKQNRMESAKSKNEDENFNMTELLSKTEDIDLTEKLMQYSMMQTVYMASLQTSSKVIQPSLIDFLK
jgi:flagellar hook-associated protein 3 FlgL